jgi:hypothetical protein
VALIDANGLHYAPDDPKYIDSVIRESEKEQPLVEGSSYTNIEGTHCQRESVLSAWEYGESSDRSSLSSSPISRQSLVAGKARQERLLASSITSMSVDRPRQSLVVAKKSPPLHPPPMPWGDVNQSTPSTIGVGTVVLKGPPPKALGRGLEDALEAGRKDAEIEQRLRREQGRERSLFDDFARECEALASPLNNQTAQALPVLLGRPPLPVQEPLKDSNQRGHPVDRDGMVNPVGVTININIDVDLERGTGTVGQLKDAI